jgi:OFA family oxalate/formate antiporter-like MFS transporter
MLPAAILGPMISARLLERANGEYDSNFTAVLLFALAALAAWFFLNRASRGGNRSVGK